MGEICDQLNSIKLSSSSIGSIPTSRSFGLTIHDISAPNIADLRPLLCLKDEQELLDLAVEGDSEAFEELIGRALPTVRRMLQRVTFTDEDAEDALQEALIKAFTKLRTLNRQSSFRTWLVRIALNSAYMENRRHKRRPRADRYRETEDQQSSFELPDQRPNPFEVLCELQLSEALERAIADLPASLREALVAQHKTNHSVREIATTLGLTETAMKSRLNRARTRVTRMIRDRIQCKPGSLDTSSEAAQASSI